MKKGITGSGDWRRVSVTMWKRGPTTDSMSGWGSAVVKATAYLRRWCPESSKANSPSWRPVYSVNFGRKIALRHQTLGGHCFPVELVGTYTSVDGKITERTVDRCDWSDGLRSNMMMMMIDAMTDGAVFMPISNIYDVLPLIARDCDCSCKSVPLPIPVDVLCDAFIM